MESHITWDTWRSTEEFQSLVIDQMAKALDSYNEKDYDHTQPQPKSQPVVKKKDPLEYYKQMNPDAQVIS